MSINNFVRDFGKKSIERSRLYFNDRAYRLAAQSAAKAIASHYGKVSPSILKQCDEYAREVLGDKKHAAGLKAFALFQQQFKEGWIPDSYYGEFVVPKLKGDYGVLGYRKSITRRLYQTELLPDLASAVNGLLYTSDFTPIPPAEFANYIFARCDRVVFKKDHGFQGKSVSFYTKDTFPTTGAHFDNGVFQSYITQHEFFNEFSTAGVSTIRITTVIDDSGAVSCRAAYLRLPQIGDTHVKSATAIKIALHVDSGKLFDTGILPDWTPLDSHPDSKIAFANQRIPEFQSCVEACLATHKNLPFARVIGWDVIVDSNNKPVIIEWNGYHNSIRFSEAAAGPCFADLGWEKLWRK